MNYIKHLNATLVTMYGDNRLLPGHVSLYLALFFYWNLHRFPDRFPVNRRELMRMGKIGSKSTYHRLMGQLDGMGYIEYAPSHSPACSSMVGLSRNWDRNGTLVERSRSIFEAYRPIGVPATLYNKTYQTYKRPSGDKPGDSSEVLDFFKEKGYRQEEALKFYHHYQAIGWKAGGKAPIVDWRAAAHNWMLRADEMKKAKGGSAAGTADRDHLIVRTQKDYGEPL